MGISKDVYSETMTMVDAVLDGTLTEEEATKQISNDYGVPFGEFFKEELEAERAKRNPAVMKEESYLEGLILRAPPAELDSFEDGGATTVNVQAEGEDKKVHLQGFADVYRVGEGLAARVYLARPEEFTGRKFWPALETVSEGGTVRIESITLCLWPSHDPSIPALQERKVKRYEQEQKQTPETE